MRRHVAARAMIAMSGVAGLLSFVPSIACGQSGAAPVASAQSHRSASYRARVLGVFDEVTGAPIENAEVFDLTTGTTALATRTGTVSLAFLPDGGSLVRIRKLGYAPIIVPIAIAPEDTVPITMTMTPVAELPAVVTRDTARRYISPGLRGFEDRRRLGITGYFIDDTTLRKEEYRTLGNVLRSSMPSVAIREGPFSAMYLTGSMRCGSGGPPQVYLDGVPVHGEIVRGREGPFNLNSINISDIAGIEFYPTTDDMPIEFNHTPTSCGALMLWTRER